LQNVKANGVVELIDFKPQYAHYFKSINIQWLNDMFELEETDHEILNDPKRVIIDSGGKIFFAKHSSLGFVGTCALLKKDEKSYELTKMGVLKNARGLKIGEALLEHVIQQANRLKIEKLYLLTNKKCQAAIHLYEKLGFEHDDRIMQQYAAKYQRADVAMRYKR
jgi:ribosomal protein S18 acetylase RimI-like enzyme